MNVFHCDICGKTTYINPPTAVATKIVMHEGQGVEVTDTTTIKRQNLYTSEIENIEIPKLVELKPKALIISLSAGDENIRKDFCRDCYAKSSIRRAVDMLWIELEKVNSVE